MNQQYVERAVATECYNFLPKPVIVTSGKDMTPVFFNGELLMQDGPNYKKFEKNPFEMARYSLERYGNSEVFENVINYAVEQVAKGGFDVISGGRTRDWPFAAVIAERLNLPFLALYKDIDVDESPLLIDPRSLVEMDLDYVKGAKVGHAVDLVTTASSVVRPNWGWIPQVKRLGGNITDVYAFIDRNQGAREAIGALGVNLHSFCSITPKWLREYDKDNLEVVKAYLENPIQWTIGYLQDNGLSALHQYVDGSWTKDDRFAKLMKINEAEFRGADLWGRIINLADSKGYQTHDGKYKGDLEKAIATLVLDEAA